MARIAETFAHFGREVSIPQLSRETGIGENTLRNRLRLGQFDADLVRPVGTLAANQVQRQPKRLEELTRGYVDSERAKCARSDAFWQFVRAPA